MLRNMKKDPKKVLVVDGSNSASSALAKAATTGMAMSEGGIIAPADVVDAARTRTTERWLEARWKILRRAFKELMAKDVDVTVAMFCNKCSKRLNATSIDALHFSFRCDCKDRVVTKGI